ncbi:uroporphyrinogen-III C-methyltransferase [Natranaerobius trueperi]|uniref:uroporphyrinogen-III C-methyltransferase n=1 Tax=Natranaerobius trueperi TaxID=759412 RepID=UPI00197C51AA|nr:uroporphyrinogen-III C-methyltransferase [Natranaerobius trueperi]
MNGKVYLVGAGPGDEGLITKKGIDCIKKADVIIYDRLISNDILTYANETTEFIYVGKVPNNHTLTQEEINQLLIEKAEAGYTVTRLKGGDPFVFGRGGEEAKALHDRKIKFEIIPGVTSSIAAPSYAGIPVTHRNVSSSFSVITGHENTDKPNSSLSWDKLATATDTLCFLMGIGNLENIVENLIKHGRDPNTPVAIVRWGTFTDQYTLTGDLTNIVQKVKKHNVKSPGVIVVGEVVNLRSSLNWFETKPLFGKKILVTRARSQASELSRNIKELGGEPVEFPTIKVEPPTSLDELDNAINNLGDYHWLIFTSQNGVNFFFHRLFYHQLDVRSLANIKICAVGRKTRECLEDKGLLVDVVPKEYRAEGLIEALKGKVKKEEKVLFPRAKKAREILPKALKDMGLEVNVVPTYQTVKESTAQEEIKTLLQENEIDAITFTSSSTVENFVDLIGTEGLENVDTFSIGPITEKTCNDLGIKVNATSDEYTIEGLVDVLTRRLGGVFDSTLI